MSKYTDPCTEVRRAPCCGLAVSIWDYEQHVSQCEIAASVCYRGMYPDEMPDVPKGIMRHIGTASGGSTWAMLEGPYDLILSHCTGPVLLFKILP